MINNIAISVVIPTRNRKASLARLLKSLQQSTYPINEVIIVDSGEEFIEENELKCFLPLSIAYVKSTPSVCIQRNIGIQRSSGSWIFLCDDDLEVPPDYLSKIVNHISSFPSTGAVTGLVLQKENETWTEQYAVQSTVDLFFRFVFQLSIWGSIEVKSRNIVVSAIKKYYKKRGNHISKAGWPILTEFGESYFKTPVYGLGACVVRKDWLTNSPYDEVLDVHGIGDNYGVALGFPSEGIHVVKTAFVYHYQATENRLSSTLRYYRRTLALYYFSRVKRRSISGTFWFLWSLVGNAIAFFYARDLLMAKATLRVLVTVLMGNNPYIKGREKNERIISPQL